MQNQPICDYSTFFLTEHFDFIIANVRRERELVQVRNPLANNILALIGEFYYHTGVRLISNFEFYYCHFSLQTVYTFVTFVFS